MAAGNSHLHALLALLALIGCCAACNSNTTMLSLTENQLQCLPELLAWGHDRRMDTRVDIWAQTQKRRGFGLVFGVSACIFPASAIKCRTPIESVDERLAEI